MRDPIRELESFDTEGPAVDPLPASEVRRRGDRMRRRNTALATVGGVAAAIAAVAVPLAVTSAGSPDAVQPATPVEWVQQVPSGFPLADGLTGRRVDDGFDATTACGTAFWTPTGTVDTDQVLLGDGVESTTSRTLALYADADRAAAALDDLRTAVEECPEAPVADATLVAEVVDRDLTTEESFSFVQRVRYDDGLYSDATTTQVARTGNALLIDQSFGSAAEDQAVEMNLANQLERAAVSLSAMCVFAAEPCQLEEVLADDATTSSGGLAGTIPDDFPLLAGLPTGTSQGGAFGPVGPGRDLEPIEPTACSRTAPGLPEPVDTLRAGWSSVSEARWRALMTFGSAAEAEQWVTAVQDLLESCPEDDLGRGATRTTALVPQDLGDDSFTAVSRNEQDGEPAPGLTVQQVVRVGQAVLFVQRVDEAAEGGQVPEDVAAEVAQESAEVVAAMR